MFNCFSDKLEAIMEIKNHKLLKKSTRGINLRKDYYII